MHTIKRIKPAHRMSQAVVHGDTVYLAGQVADNRSLNVKEQTEQVLAKIDSLLAAAGTDKAHILMATIWLANIKEFDSMNTAWDAWVPIEASPARACVESRLAKPDIQVEIRVVAAV